MEKFAQWHPGGMFVLQHNIGRDISKFFYGGYVLEDNLSGPSPKGYNHSEVAKRIVRKLTVASYESQSQIAPQSASISKSHEITPLISTFTLQSTADKVRDFKSYYPGVNMIAKHFLVMDGRNQKVKRHYTISNAMIPAVYSEYLRVLKTGNGSDFNDALLASADSNQIHLTIKNYKRNAGLSFRFHSQDSSDYTVQGPMGRGLQPNLKGLHIAFAAGTGVLCFVDLVAHLILSELNIIDRV